MSESLYLLKTSYVCAQGEMFCMHVCMYMYILLALKGTSNLQHALEVQSRLMPLQEGDLHQESQ